MAGVGDVMLRRAFLQFLSLAPVAAQALSVQEEIVSVARGNRGRLFDANGNPIDKAIEANLRTGRVLQFETDANGQIVIDKQRHVAVRVERWFSAPLRFDHNHRWEAIVQEYANCPETA